MNKKKKKYRTFDEIVEERFKEHPDEIAGFVQTVLEEYEKEPDEGALLSALRQVAIAQGGMTELAKKTNLSRERLYKTLSREGNPRLKNLRRILQAFGYTLTFKPVEISRR
ncbi:MAG: addiction module antidote protein [Candidatus Omnitrophota bacterium]